MKALGGGLLLIGLAAGLTATGLFADPLVGLRVPRFVPGLVGVAFCAAAGMAWFRYDPVLNNGFAAVFLGVMASIAFFVAFQGDAEQMSGGIPLLPDSVNTTLGRLSFGFGGVISAALAVYAAVLCRRAMNTPHGESQDAAPGSGRSNQSHTI